MRQLPEVNPGQRDFSKTPYSTLDPEEATRLLSFVGYRQVSNRFRHLARVDIDDIELQFFLKKKLSWKDTHLYQGDPGGWQDFYRRCYSRDLIENVPEEIMRMMRNLIDYRYPDTHLIPPPK